MFFVISGICTFQIVNYALSATCSAPWSKAPPHTINFYNFFLVLPNLDKKSPSKYFKSILASAIMEVYWLSIVCLPLPWLIGNMKRVRNKMLLQKWVTVLVSSEWLAATVLVHALTIMWGRPAFLEKEKKNSKSCCWRYSSKYYFSCYRSSRSGPYMGRIACKTWTVSQIII